MYKSPCKVWTSCWQEVLESGGPFKLYYLYSGVNSDSMNLILVIVENVEKMHDWLGNVDVRNVILATYIFA